MKPFFGKIFTVQFLILCAASVVAIFDPSPDMSQSDSWGCFAGACDILCYLFIDYADEETQMHPGS